MDTYKELDAKFHFRSFEAKNTNFSSSLEGTFYSNSSDKIDNMMAHVFAGGLIRYSVPTTYHMDELPYYILIYTKSGEAKLSSKNLMLNAGSTILIPPMQALDFETALTPFSYYMYFIEGESLKSYSNILNSVIDMRGNFVTDCLYQIDRLLTTQDLQSDYIISGLLTSILTEAVLKSSSADMEVLKLPKHIFQLKSILDSQYSSFHTLDALEEELKISKYRLCREFSSYLGISPLKYLNAVRIEHAKDLLIQTDMTINAIGNSVGIPNTTHFIHLFERELGTTPLKYRNIKKHP